MARYDQITVGRFIERPNRFISKIEIEGKTETVHVKNTGRCKELLTPGATVYVEKSKNPQRKTKWDLIGVEKNERMINMDSQIPNQVAKEWIQNGGLGKDITYIKPEYTYGESRLDLYAEGQQTDAVSGEEVQRKIFVEVKGVTLEEAGVVRFPDAPSLRAIKHVKELEKAVKEGYEAYILFVIQMEGVRYFTPNMDTQPEFCEALRSAQKNGVQILAYDCHVEKDSIEIRQPVPVILGQPKLYEMRENLLNWYRGEKRDLPWRRTRDPYRIWLSEIMLQQTRVEAVKAYYKRFLENLPTVSDLADAREETILKLWEGLGYYNRVRNMQKAAKQIMEVHDGNFPKSYEGIMELSGIGSYTAGAIGSIAFGLPYPAVDGNVLRVISRILGSREDIAKQSVKKQMEEWIREIIPEDAASDFNQSLIELGAIVCVPNGSPKCQECPVSQWCKAYQENLTGEIPVKAKAKARRIEKKTVMIFKDNQKIAIQKRPKKGLLAGLYELPNLEGHLTQKEMVAYSKSIGLMPIRIQKLKKAKHIFSHIEWDMIGYEIIVDELEKSCTEPMLFVSQQEIQKVYPIPSAFDAYLLTWMGA